MIVGITTVCQNVKVHSTNLKTISNQMPELVSLASLKVLVGKKCGYMAVSDTAEMEELTNLILIIQMLVSFILTQAILTYPVEKEKRL